MRPRWIFSISSHSVRGIKKIPNTRVHTCKCRPTSCLWHWPGVLYSYTIDTDIMYYMESAIIHFYSDTKERIETFWRIDVDLIHGLGQSLVITDTNFPTTIDGVPGPCWGTRNLTHFSKYAGLGGVSSISHWKQKPAAIHNGHSRAGYESKCELRTGTNANTKTLLSE